MSELIESIDSIPEKPLEIFTQKLVSSLEKIQDWVLNSSYELGALYERYESLLQVNLIKESDRHASKILGSTFATGTCATVIALTGAIQGKPTDEWLQMATAGPVLAFGAITAVAAAESAGQAVLEKIESLIPDIKGSEQIK